MRFQYLVWSLWLLRASAYPHREEARGLKLVARKEPWNGLLPVEDDWPAFVPPQKEDLPDVVRRNAVSRKELWDGPLPAEDWSVVTKDKRSTMKRVPEITGLSKRNPEGTDISAREMTDFELYSYIGLHGVAIAHGVKSFYSLVNDCKEFADGDQSSFNCIWDSIATMIGFACTAHGVYRTWATLDQRLRENNMVIPYLAGGDMPYANQLPGGTAKRDIIPHMEEVLSSVLRSEVRHVGDFEDPHAPPLKRDGSDHDGAVDNTRSVFGVNVGGVPMHLAYMGETENGALIKLGHGPGPETELNKRRLQGRATPEYNNQYFDSGGLIMASETDPRERNSDDMFFNPDDAQQYNWLVEQVKCYMGSITSGPTAPSGSMMSATALQFQVYNSKDEWTLSHGMIAPFDKENAPYQDLKVEGGVETSPGCTAQ